MSNQKPSKEWYEDWSYEVSPPSSDGLSDVYFRLPNTSISQKIWNVKCSQDSEVRALTILLETALYELTNKEEPPINPATKIHEISEGTYKGKPVEEMTRNELKDAFIDTAKLYQRVLMKRRSELV